MFPGGKRDRTPTPPWLVWGAAAFIGVAILLNLLGITPRPQSGELSSTPTASESGWRLLSLETYKSRIIPGYGQLQIAERAPGEGMPAVCGQEVEITYTEHASAADTKEPSPTPVTATFRLGDRDVSVALQEAVLGMRAGGARSVIVPPERTQEGNRTLRYEIALLRAGPPLSAPPEGEMPLKVFERRVGAMQPVRCGDTAKAHLTVWDPSGRELLNTRALGIPLGIMPGAGSVMLGLETGLLGMQADASRTLLIPPSLQKPLRPESETSAGQEGNPLHKLALPESQVIIVDVDLIP